MPWTPGGASGRIASPEECGETRKTPRISAASTSTLPKVMTLITTAPGRTPRAWNPASSSITAAASHGTSDRGRPASWDMYSANATATAAVAPDWTISSSDQPCRNATIGWKASRKKAYWPPTRGITVLSSANTNAPSSAMAPPPTHTPTIRKGVPTACATT
jgi:hypothetical protein